MDKNGLTRITFLDKNNHLSEVFIFADGAVSFIPRFAKKPLVIDRNAKKVRDITDNEKKQIVEYKKHDCE